MNVDYAEHAVEVLEVVGLVQFHSVEQGEELLVEAAAHVESDRDVVHGDTGERSQHPEHVLAYLRNGLQILSGERLLLSDRSVSHDAEAARSDDDFGELERSYREGDLHGDRCRAHLECLLCDTVAEPVDTDRVSAVWHGREYERAVLPSQCTQPSLQDAHFGAPDRRAACAVTDPACHTCIELLAPGPGPTWLGASTARPPDTLTP